MNDIKLNLNRFNQMKENYYVFLCYLHEILIFPSSELTLEYMVAGVNKIVGT